MADAEDLVFVDFKESFLADCLELFDQNCPDHFAPNERSDYRSYLCSRAAGYKLGLSKDRLMAAFGVDMEDRCGRARMTWMMVSPNSKGQGVGAKMMLYAKQIVKDKNLDVINIAASHLSEPFFSKFGAVRVGFLKDGWGESMHRVDMELPV